MSDDGTTIDGQDDGPKGLRATVERLQNQVKELTEERDTLRGAVRSSAFRQAGIDPEKGIGKAIATVYTGDPDPAKIVEFAKSEFDWQAAPSPNEQMGQMLVDAQGRVQQVLDASTSAQEANIDSEIAKAQQAGDYVRLAQLQVQKLTGQRSGAVV